ncbi:MAG: nuclear transport factor 2 family protein [Chloroflexi bacterium]|nr:nuclear transport factor 2 family protein [Chloroflexota bacterium]
MINAFNAAMNAESAAGALALFTDDGSIKTPQRLHAGKAEVSRWLEEHTAKNARIAVVGSVQAAGDKATWAANVSRTDWQQMGLPALEHRYEAVVQAGKITSLAFSRSPAHEAMLRAAQARLALPRTGEPVAPLSSALVVGAALVAVGMLIRRAGRAA